MANSLWCYGSYYIIITSHNMEYLYKHVGVNSYYSTFTDPEPTGPLMQYRVNINRFCNSLIKCDKSAEY